MKGEDVLYNSNNFKELMCEGYQKSASDDLFFAENSLAIAMETWPEYNEGVKMKELDEVREKIDDFLWVKCLGDTAKIRNQILSIPELAIVDRKAQLPTGKYNLATLVDVSRLVFKLKDGSLIEETALDWARIGYRQCQEDMADWVKEVKDGQDTKG